ncbi:hypothetical protein ABEB36_002606 [Hypothenemus hampei]|uniref:Ataxin-10 n=1 Tax=Hypothenemus hampei TaxID=57062 RepID=A0ABD1F836_HYPHA
MSDLNPNIASYYGIPSATDHLIKQEPIILVLTDPERQLIVPDIWTGSYKTISDWLKKEFIPNSQFIAIIDIRFIDQLFIALNRIVNNTTEEHAIEDEAAEALTELLKTIRILVTKEDVLTYLYVNQSEDFKNCIRQLANHLFTESHGHQIYTKYFTQFLLNVLAKNNDKKTLEDVFQIINMSNVYNLFKNFIGFTKEMCAFIWRSHCLVPIVDMELIVKLFEYQANEQLRNEYLDFTVLNLVMTPFIWQHYDEFQPAIRIRILTCLRDRDALGCQHCDKQVPVEVVESLVLVFIEHSPEIFKTSRSDDPILATELSLILEILAHLSSEEMNLPRMNDRKLFVIVGVILINVHKLGKKNGSVFTPIQTLAQLQSSTNEVKTNPVFGFKTDLVRLIGNMCWKNEDMQDLARTAELIPVLLECCTIDANNPFITQWAILAIRNLCENNQANQAVIGSLSKQGTVSTEILDKLGLKLHCDDTEKSIGIVQFKMVKK